MALRITKEEGSCSFRVRLSPRGRRDEVVGLYGDALKIRVKAPPVDGRANRALCEFLADRFGVTASDVEILSGHASRRKRIRVWGVSPAAVRALVSR